MLLLDDSITHPYITVSRCWGRRTKDAWGRRQPVKINRMPVTAWMGNGLVGCMLRKKWCVTQTIAFENAIVAVAAHRFHLSRPSRGQMIWGIDENDITKGHVSIRCANGRCNSAVRGTFACIFAQSNSRVSTALFSTQVHSSPPRWASKMQNVVWNRNWVGHGIHPRWLGG